MRINELLVEQQLDELGLGQVGRAIGKGVGGLAKGIGATVGGAVGAWDAAKQGYQAGRATVGGTGVTGQGPNATVGPNRTAPSGTQPGTTTTPATQSTVQTTTPAQQTTPAALALNQQQADRQAKIGVGQINKIIPTLRTRDLQSLKKNLDTVMAQKLKQPTAPTATGQPNLQVQQGGKQTGAVNPTATQGASAVPESKEFYSKFLGKNL